LSSSGQTRHSNDFIASSVDPSVGTKQSDTDREVELTEDKASRILAYLDRRDAANAQKHSVLSDERSMVAQSVRASLVSSSEDIKAFSDIEGGLTEWAYLLRRQPGGSNGSDRDDRGLTAAQNALLDRFITEGGHNPKLSPKKIEFIINHGGIIKLEIPIQGMNGSEAMLPIGTVASISSLLHTMEDGSPFQNLDPRYKTGLLIPDIRKENVIRSADQWFVDYRSSTRGPITAEQLKKEEFGRKIIVELGGALAPEWEGFDPRRMGIAALGKYISIHSMGGQKELFTFNIGQISRANDPDDIFGVNEPSLSHNHYAKKWAERGYTDELVPDLAFMCWTAYRAHMDEVRTWARDLLTSKGYDWANVEDQAESIKAQIQLLISQDAHAPL